MKIKFVGALILLSWAVLFTACKKAENSQTNSNTSAAASKQTASSQIALSLYQSLTGQSGGVNINDGVKTPGIANSNSSTAKVNSSDYLCGFYVNNGINYNTNIGDSIKSVSHGALAFYFVCKNGSAVGFTAQDTLTTYGTAPGYNFIDGLSQNLVVAGLNPNNSLVTVNGLLQSRVDIFYTKGGRSATYNSFQLSGLQVHLDQNPPDITSGTAVFTAKGFNNATIFDLYGTITFLGNHMVKVDFYDDIFYVNLLTGKVTTTI